MKPYTEGMSITGVLIATGLTGALALVLAQVMTQQARVQKTIFSSQEIASHVDHLKMVLANSEICSKNFEDQEINPALFNAAQTIQGLSANTLKIKQAGTGSTLGAVIAEKDLQLPNQSGKIKEISLILTGKTDAAPQVTLYGEIKIQYEPPAAFIGGRSVMRALPVRFLAETLGGVTRIKSCSSQGELKMTCSSHRYNLPVHTQISHTAKYACPSSAGSQAVMVGCQVLSYPAGEFTCGHTIHPAVGPQGGNPAEAAYCQAAGCNAISGQFWGVNVTCCDSGGELLSIPNPNPSPSPVVVRFETKDCYCPCGLGYGPCCNFPPPGLTACNTGSGIKPYAYLKVACPSGYKITGASCWAHGTDESCSSRVVKSENSAYCHGHAHDASGLIHPSCQAVCTQGVIHE